MLLLLPNSEVKSIKITLCYTGFFDTLATPPQKYIAKMVLVCYNVFGLFVRHLSWFVEGVAKVLKHPVFSL